VCLYCQILTKIFVFVDFIITLQCKNVNNNFQQMHFSYIYYIFQYSYMFRSVRAILRELHSKIIYIKPHIVLALDHFTV
jgi:hypothetical protein